MDPRGSFESRPETHLERPSPSSQHSIGPGYLGHSNGVPFEFRRVLLSEISSGEADTRRCRGAAPMPWAAKTMCRNVGCGRLVAKPGWCEVHRGLEQRNDHLERKSRPAVDVAIDGLYKTAAWRRLRALLLREEPLVRACRGESLGDAAVMVDHIAPVKLRSMGFARSAVQCSAAPERRGMVGLRPASRENAQGARFVKSWRRCSFRVAAPRLTAGCRCGRPDQPPQVNQHLTSAVSKEIYASKLS